MFVNSISYSLSDQHTEKLLGIKNIIQIDILDFGGQQVYYTTHQTYLSKRALYLLVFKLSKKLDGLGKEEDMHENSEADKTVLGRINRFLRPQHKEYENEHSIITRSRQDPHIISP